MNKTVAYTRDTYAQELEEKIQFASPDKDPSFVLSGPWKKLVEEKDGLKIFAVDERWVYANLSVIFCHGGHGLVHEFIPINEIWVSTHHYSCECKNVSEMQPVSKEFFASTAHHERVELRAMQEGKIYWEAHDIALRAEIELGLLSDPYAD